MADKDHRESKPPNRYQARLLGEDLDELLDQGDPIALRNPDEINDYEKPQKHLQVLGTKILMSSFNFLEHLTKSSFGNTQNTNAWSKNIRSSLHNLESPFLA